MNKDRNINKKALKKFLNLIDKETDMKSCLSRFPNDNENLKVYAEIIESFKNLKNIHIDKDFEKNSLKNIYSRARTENLKNNEKISKKDALLIRFCPAYLKPMIIFISILIFTSFSFAGTIYASGDSVPGDVLYTVKRTSENLQVTLTPYKYENALYLKMLDSRLNEANIILNQADFTDTTTAEKLIADIDNTYERCHKRNYLNANEESQIQLRIGEVKEGFRKRYGMRKNDVENLNKQELEDNTTGFNTDYQGLEQNNPGVDGNTENNNYSNNTGEQNQNGNQSRHGK